MEDKGSFLIAERRALDLMIDALKGEELARNEAERDIYLQLAKTWHEAELRQEQSLALIAESKALLGRFKK